MSSESHTIETQAVHAGREDLTDAGVHALPIDLSTTNPLPDIETGGHSYETMATGGRQPSDGSAVYARLWNPTVARFESGLATMENAEAAVAFSSGWPVSRRPCWRCAPVRTKPMWSPSDLSTAAPTTC